MASAALSRELECPVCLTIYTDPVNLRCGHNFCRECINQHLDTQEGSGGYSCPECREGFMERPTLQRNIALRNIAESFLSTQPDQEEAGVFCSNCVDSSVKAVKYCLHCDVSLCGKHLRAHSKAPEHALCDPNTSLENRKCSVHKKILEYYCTEDAACICVSCRLDGEHQGHQVEMLNEASEMKKKKLRNVLQKLMAETEEAEKRVQSLEERRRKAQEKADGEIERVTVLFRDLRGRLENLENRVLSDIIRQAQQLSQSYNDVIQQLEIKKEELSRKKLHTEELCNMTDPLTVLQESDTGDLCDTEDRERHDKQLHDGGDLDVAGISHTLHTGLSDIMSGVIVQKHTDTQAYPHSSTEDKVPITAKLSRPHPQLTPTVQRKQASPHSSTEDKVPITATLSRPHPQPTPTAQHTQAYPHSSTEDKVPITAKLSRPRPQPTPTTQHTQRQAGWKMFRSGILYTLYTRLYDMVTVQQTSGVVVQIHTDTQASLHSSTESKVPITAKVSRPRPQPTPTAQHTQVYPYSSTEDKVPITAKLSRPRPQPTTQHTQRQAGGTNIGAAQQTSGLPVYADILLNVNTATNNLQISADRKTASRTNRSQNRPETPERFEYAQVLSSQRFSSGRHYWEVDVGRSVQWRVGMCYHSIARKGCQSVVGDNNKSWCLERWNNRYLVIHDMKEIQLPGRIPSDRVRICLDYEAGRISFYALCDPIRLLHTFTAAFTEPLHAVIYIYAGCVKISGRRIRGGKRSAHW
ncbi:E3 ubiquitin/ISG15 ligase TRIM25-like [Hyperolius riggenbachi]|uniref:E3 ubiquitin/ISG15 ligase TRIM25-like n=1 Tax=Hyperolius riggenbachi TaxID=752182 RepID=UPI0035A2C3D2